jgi:hypothetical protein
VLVVDPVRALWERVERGCTRRWLAAAVRRELVTVAAATEDRDRAEQVLAARLQRRLAAQGGPERVADPVGWILKKGLPRGGSCAHLRCDDGTRMDSGLPCEACASRLAGLRALRQQVAAEVAAELPQGTAEQRRAEVESRLRAEAQASSERQAARFEREAAEVAARQVAVEPLRAAAAAAARARQALCVSGCGRDAEDRLSGLCRFCFAETEAFVEAELTPIPFADELDDDGRRLLLRLMRVNDAAVAVVGQAQRWVCREPSCRRQMCGVPPESGLCAPCERTAAGLPAPFQAVTS